MVIFVQATALRYDPDLDFECSYHHIFPETPDVFVLRRGLVTSADLTRFDYCLNLLEYD